MEHILNKHHSCILLGQCNTCSNDCRDMYNTVQAWPIGRPPPPLPHFCKSDYGLVVESDSIYLNLYAQNGLICRVESTMYTIVGLIREVSLFQRSLNPSVWPARPLFPSPDYYFEIHLSIVNRRGENGSTYIADQTINLYPKVRFYQPVNFMVT